MLCKDCQYFDIFSEKDANMIWRNPLRNSFPPKGLGHCDTACFDALRTADTEACANFVERIQLQTEFVDDFGPRE